MSKLFLCFVLVFAYISTTSVSEASESLISLLKEKPLRFCAGTHEWPPYYYFKRTDGEISNQIEGFDIDLFKEVFSRNNIPYTVELVFWKRCLAEGKKGKLYDVVFGGGLNDQRRADYVTTRGYYSVVPSYFYLKEQFPSGVQAKTPTDLKKNGSLCGVRGFNYANFGQNNDDIDMGAKTYSKLVDKTLRNRCKISFVRYEILAGWGSLLGKDFIGNNKLTFKPVPDNPEESFHLMISKNYKYANELKVFFESEVQKLKLSGKFKSMLSKYNNNNNDKKGVITVTVNPETDNIIRALAEDDGQTVTNMTHKLITEALQARQLLTVKENH